MHRYVCIQTCFRRVVHVEESVSMQEHFEQSVGKQSRLQGKLNHEGLIV